jgi:hypothetical protein
MSRVARLAVLLKLSSCLLLAFPVVGSAADPATPAERVLRFPSDRVIGVVFHRPRPEGSYLYTGYKSWDRISD